MNKNKKIFNLLIICTLIAFVFSVFWIPKQIAHSAKLTKKCTIKPKPREFKNSAYYTGSLIDDHLHIPVSSGIVSAVGNRIGFKGMTSFSGKLTPDYLACLLEEEGIINTFGFFLTTKFSLNQEINTAKKFSKNTAGKVTPFFMPGPYDTLRVDIASVEKSLTKNTNLFRGIGEIKSFDDSTLDAHKFLELYDIAKSRGLIVMMHPYQQHQEVVEKILKKYPDVTFLMHGGDADRWIVDIIKNYPNAYYSLDANLFNLYGWEWPKHGKQQPSKDEWLAYIRKNFDSVLNESLSRWKGNIESYPNRFLWGSDRWYGWHYDEEVSRLIIEFSRTFIGGLSPSAQERFAYKNAENLLKK